MIKWLKSLSRQARIMIVIIILLVACIIMRWQWIVGEAGSAFKNRFEQVKDKP